MKIRIILKAMDSFTIEPKRASKRYELLAELKKIEKENEETNISKHFWAAGDYMRKAIERGIHQ